MIDWKGIVHRVAHEVESEIERRLPERSIPPSRQLIVPFRSYGTAQALQVRGRVIADPGLQRREEPGSRWVNLRDTWRRVRSAEIAGAKLTLSLDEAEQPAATDDEGYFTATIAPSHLDAQSLWHEVDVALDGSEVRVCAPVLVPPARARFGIISDIDDTIVRTEATSLIRMVKTVAFHDARMRMAFPGVAGFYRALHQECNPLFLVSSGPWNFYDLLIEFFELQEIPPAPVLLQDWGIDSRKLIIASHEDHKLREIERILATYPQLPFILIGDSGQRDPEIYERVVHDFPGRVLAVYIRDVSESARDDEVHAIAARLRERGVDVVLAATTAEPAKDALHRGWIRPEDFDEVQKALAGDGEPVAAAGQ